MKMSDLFEFSVTTEEPIDEHAEAKQAIEEALLDVSGGVRMDTGQEPQYLYTCVTKGIWNEVRVSGRLQPSGFSGHIVASDEPSKKPGMEGDIMLQIQFNSHDGWYARTIRGQVYAVTRYPISQHKIKNMGPARY